MKKITLQPMTRQLAHRFFREFQADPDILAENQEYKPYTYTRDVCNAYFERQQSLGRIYLAIMLDATPIGEIILKNIDYQEGHCRLSIHLKNDSVKNKGYGTAAEKQALQYAFDKLKLNTVYADALTKNTRSRHVLEKAGFQLILNDGIYCYYSCNKPAI